MEHEFISIRRDRLLAGSSLVPSNQRATFFATLLIGPNEISTDTESISFPISTEQAREIKSKIDESTWAVISTIVANAKDDVGTINWPDVKKLTGVTSWNQFAKGRMGGLHRSLRKIEGVSEDAVLVWEGDGWVEDDSGDYSAGMLCIDGPAIHTLRAVCGFHD